MTPYYEDDWVTIYHGDCRDVLADLGQADMVLTDPPYGVALQTSTLARGRLSRGNAWAAIVGDDRPFDPSHLLALAPSVVLFGANHYADKLPASPSWIVWDKVDGLSSDRAVGFNNMADCEMAWSNLGGPARIFRHRWMGYFRAAEARDRHHPTQKPLALMRWVIVNWSVEGALILDPYMGSGTTLRAAKDLGRKAIGIEIEERYCEIAAHRCSQEVIDLYPQEALA